eukprot:CAMPEP_0201522722 /NCGR_PEP_ID=MMETSP0161_2-20130828/18514_1 /ASSEMBLY_ACC=CAM_ASM_000251 /TAXON_ID=180227 /ORGANISM="Neoparamoeba aestuarina, Strain SoJaBio B1-5/56/2" /LENGTH=80 /DNA_ID=CAMNT_0047921645 /DNA_START=35 /DNA_END=273 /DNA_ORIENTATION=+
MRSSRCLTFPSLTRILFCESQAPSAPTLMPITPAYTSAFLESDEYKYHIESVEEMRKQQDEDRIKSTEMERIRRTAKHVG